MSIYLETANKQIAKGIVGLDIIKSNLAKHYELEDKAGWVKAKQSEYDILYPKMRLVTQEEYEADKNLSINTEMPLWQDLSQEYKSTLLTPIDYTQTENYKNFNDWLNETKTVLIGTELVVDGNGVEYEKEIFEEQLVRLYIANDVSVLVEEYLKPSLVAKTKQDSLAYLNSTDWYIVRKAETGVEVPAEVVIKRQLCRESI